jgi:hypothetical protein
MKFVQKLSPAVKYGEPIRPVLFTTESHYYGWDPVPVLDLPTPVSVVATEVDIAYENKNIYLTIKRKIEIKMR